MKCPHLATLRLLLDEQLPADEFRQIEAHVEECSHCRATLEWLTRGDESQPPPRSSGPDATTVTAGPGTAAPPAPPAAQPSRYRPVRFHARGGLGEVFVAEDAELHREVALKRMQDRFQGDADSRRRFLQEAEVTGRLEHPGVVPVYGLGLDAEGQPCYAMRFIRGQTLHEAIKRFHEAERPGRDPGERSLALRELLGRFLAVCNTVGYAHSRGILHRDLKPGNVMLGKYGETLVVDWGLAKPIERDEADRAGPEETLTPASATGDSATRVGQAMGTPAYMSPEQAAGEWARVGPASDVYSLGTILYTILTGKAPFPEADVKLKLVQVQLGEFAPPRRLKRDCPPALEAVCLKAMALKPADRYATALALAADVEHWLADEPVGAWREPWHVRARRWLRRHRALAGAAAAAAVLALLAGGAAYALARQHRRAQLEQTARLVHQALGEATTLRQQAARLADQPQRTADLWRAAALAAGRAEQALANGTAEASTREHVESVTRAIRAEAAEADRDRAMLRQLEEARNLQAIGVKDSDYVRPRAIEEIATWGLAASPAYAAAFRKYDIDVEKLTTPEAAERLRQRPIRLQLATALDDWFGLDPAAAQGRLLKIARAADPDPLRNRVRAAIAGKDRKALKQLAEGDGTPQLPGPTLILLSHVLHQQRMRPEALQLMKRAQGRHADDFWFNDTLGLHLQYANPPDYPAAARCFTAVIALRPKSPVGWYDLAYVLTNEGRLDEAIAAAKQCLDLRPDFTRGYAPLIHCLAEQGAVDEALAAIQKGLDRQPDSPMLLMLLGQVREARGETGDAVAIYQNVLDRNPDWVWARISLAGILSARGRIGEALKHLATAERTHPRVPMIYTARAGVLLRLGDTTGAVAAYRKAIEIGHRPFIDLSLLGVALSRQGKHEEALEAHRKAVRMVPRSGLILTMMAQSLLLQGKVEEALATAREAVQLSPRNSLAHDHLAEVLLKKKEYARAVESLREATRFAPGRQIFRIKLGNGLAMLGLSLLQERQYAEAEPVCRECLTIRQQVVPGRWATFNAKAMLGGSLLGQKKYAKAEPLLLQGYEGMKQHEAKIPPQARPRLREAVQWLVELYEARQKPDEAARWRKVLAALKTPPG